MPIDRVIYHDDFQCPRHAAGNISRRQIYNCRHRPRARSTTNQMLPARHEFTFRIASTCTYRLPCFDPLSVTPCRLIASMSISRMRYEPLVSSNVTIWLPFAFWHMDTTAGRPLEQQLASQPAESKSGHATDSLRSLADLRDIFHAGV